jgi:RNA polymerase sigma factor (TIGR02999 family)
MMFTAGWNFRPPVRSLHMLAASVPTEGSPPAEMFEVLYEELRRLSRRQLARAGRGAALGATTLLHEVYLGLSGRQQAVFPDRARFMAYAAQAMRGMIIDHARRCHAHKRGGGAPITTLDEHHLPPAGEDLVRIGEAVEELAAVEPALAEVVDLKFFCGFSFGEIAALRGVSERTVQRQWEKARLFLHASMRSP